LALVGVWAILAGPVHAENPYAAAGISNPAHVTEFLARLQRAVAGDDRAAAAAMVKYPLTVRPLNARQTTYPNAAALTADYAQVFTPDIKAVVAAAKPDNLFARDQGVMIGNGEIWMTEVDGTVKIIAVNR